MQLPRLSCKEGRGQGAGWYARQQPQRSKREGMRCNSPASPVRRGGGKGAGRYVSAGSVIPIYRDCKRNVLPFARVRRRPRLLKIILLRLDKSQLPPRNEAVIPS